MYHNTREDTIAALATPPGEGGVAIIRVAGPRAVELVSGVCSSSIEDCPSHSLCRRNIVTSEGDLIDEALVVVMRAPRSYTGENTAEVHCHGGRWVSQRVLQRILEMGARAALPGEFTFRAYMNGKLDLAQAEAVQGVIGAKTALALTAAGEQLQGKLSTKIRSMQQDLIDATAVLEAWIDFPEEGLEIAPFEALKLRLEHVQDEIQALVRSFDTGRILHEGLTVCIVGAPNVGKSSLLNALLGHDRAIVTDIPGTTRDTLEGEIRLGGAHCRIIDTAGMRETSELVEQEGIRRSLQAMRGADIVLVVLDLTRSPTEEEVKLCSQLGSTQHLIVWNKADLVGQASSEEKLCISVKTGDGIDRLKESIDRLIGAREALSKEEVVITQLRHRQALEQALAYLTQAYMAVVSRTAPELIVLDLRFALRELGSIIGQDVTEEILTSVFSQFCIGK